MRPEESDCRLHPVVRHGEKGRARHDRQFARCAAESKSPTVERIPVPPSSPARSHRAHNRLQIPATRPLTSQSSIVPLHRQARPPRYKRWCRKRSSLAVANSLDRLVNGGLVDAPLTGHLTCIGGFVPPFSFRPFVPALFEN